MISFLGAGCESSDGTMTGSSAVGVGWKGTGCCRGIPRVNPEFRAEQEEEEGPAWLTEQDEDEEEVEDEETLPTITHPLAVWFCAAKWEALMGTGIWRPALLTDGQTEEEDEDDEGGAKEGPTMLPDAAPTGLAVRGPALLSGGFSANLAGSKGTSGLRTITGESLWD